MARKMVLVDPEVLKPTRGVIPDAKPEEITRLDNEIETILKLPGGTDLSDKLTKYNQVLNKYLGLVHGLRQTNPAPLPTPHPPTTSPTPPAVSAEKPLSMETNIDYITPKYQNKAKRLLDFTRSIPELSWTKKGELTVNQKVYPDSHIVDLISAAVRPRSVRGRPGGLPYAEFLRVLQAANTPKDLVSADVGRLWGRVSPPSPVLSATPSPSRIPVSRKRRRLSPSKTKSVAFTWSRN